MALITTWTILEEIITTIDHFFPFHLKLIHVMILFLLIKNHPLFPWQHLFSLSTHKKKKIEKKSMAMEENSKSNNFQSRCIETFEKKDKQEKVEEWKKEMLMLVIDKLTNQNFYILIMMVKKMLLLRVELIVLHICHPLWF